MITIFNMETRKYHTFENTKFPDGTTQAWKVTPEPTKKDKFFITWQFTSESELSTILQLAMLLSKFNQVPRLYMPFLPWGRQDKAIENNQTFAGNVLLNILDDHFYLETFDCHSAELSRKFNIHNHEPEEFFRSVIGDRIYDLIVYPDAGAFNRYHSTMIKGNYAICDKKRNQQTGEITGLSLYSDFEIEGQRILIIDDICDGGRTFIEVAKILKEKKAASIDLAVSHGIFSKGKQVLHDAGIRKIYTTNSLAKNAGHFNVLF